MIQLAGGSSLELPRRHEDTSMLRFCLRVTLHFVPEVKVFASN